METILSSQSLAVGTKHSNESAHIAERLQCTPSRQQPNNSQTGQASLARAGWGLSALSAQIGYIVP